MIEGWGLASGGVLMNEDPRSALIAFEQFERWAVDRLGPDHAAVAQALVRQAWCELAVGNQARACRLYERALDVLRVSVGSDHPDAVRLAEYVSEACTSDSGIGQRLESDRKPLSPPQTLEGLQPFNPLEMEGTTDRSLTAIEEHVTRALEATGEPVPLPEVDDPEPHEYTLGMFLREIGEFDRSIEAFEDYERWAARTYGANDDRTVEALNQLAYCHYRAGHFADACRFWEQTRSLLQSIHPESPSIEILSARLADLCPPAPDRWFFGLAEQLREDEHNKEAIAAYSAYERWASREYGPAHEQVLDSLAMQGYCHEQLGHVANACSLYQRVLGLVGDRELSFLDVGELRAYVAEHCADGRHSTEVGGTGWHWPWDPPSLSEVEPQLETIGDLLAAGHHHGEAISAYESFEQWLGREGGSGGAALAPIIAKRAWNHAQLGHHDEACRLTAEAKQLWEAESGPDDEFVIAAREYLEKNCS